MGARVQIEWLMTALDACKLDTGSYPTTAQGLDALNLDRAIPLDPWGHPYVYRYPGEHGEAPDIFSYGADGQPGRVGIAADVHSEDR